MSNVKENTNKNEEDKVKTQQEAQPVIEAIEEDDEFEEFEPCHWDVQDEDAEDAQQWQVRILKSKSESACSILLI